MLRLRFRGIHGGVRRCTLKSFMNGNFVFALSLIVVSMALGDRISDGVLAIGIGVGVIFTLIGLIQMYREKARRPGP